MEQNKIDIKKEYLKLKQLDRIEYTQGVQFIYETSKYKTMSSSTKILAVTPFFFIILGAITGVNQETSSEILCLFLSTFFMLGFLLSSLSDIINQKRIIKNRENRLNELNLRCFKTEVVN